MVPHDSEVLRDVRDRDRDRSHEHSRADAAPEQERDHDREQERRKREHRVHEHDRARGRARRRSSRRRGRAERRRRARTPARAQRPSSSVWAPHTMRASTSVDCTVVPNQCAERRVRELREPLPAGLVLVEGVRRDERREDREDDEEERQPGADPGASRARTRAPPRSGSNARRSPTVRAVEPHRGRDGRHQYRTRGSIIRIDEVDDDADEHDDEREDDDDSLHRRVVAVLRGTCTGSWPIPGQLNVVSVSTAPPSRSASWRPTTVIDRDERVRERVPVHDRALVDPARPGRLDVVLLQRPDHVDADEPDEDAAVHEAEGRRGQDEVLDHVPQRAPVAVDDRVDEEDVRVRLEQRLGQRARLIRGRQPVEPDAEDELSDQAEEEHRRRVDDDAEQAPAGVDRGVAEAAGDEADDEADDERDQEREERQLEGRRSVDEDDVARQDGCRRSSSRSCHAGCSRGSPRTARTAACRSRACA